MAEYAEEISNPENKKVCVGSGGEGGRRVQAEINVSLQRVSSEL